MIVQDVINAARYSELGNTAIKDNTDAILTFMNLGLLELHKRFPLRVEQTVLTLSNTTTTFNLPSTFMYPLAAYGEDKDGNIDMEHVLPINDESNPESIFFSTFKQVQVPDTLDGSSAVIVFAAKPDKYTADDLNIELDLPETLIEPLLHYIGYKAQLGIRGDAQAENNAHWLRFDRSCKQAQDLGVAYPMDSWKMATRIYDRGFA